MAREHHKKLIDITSAIVLLALFALGFAIGRDVFLSVAENATPAHIYFLPVTQGESALLVLPGGVTVLTDAGSDDGIIDDLPKILPEGGSQYIDLAIISYPQLADYEGYQYLLAHYSVGAFLYNGRNDTAHVAEWTQLLSTITAKHIPLIAIGSGDHIRYANVVDIDILSPDAAFARSPDPVDTAIVQRLVTPKLSVLLTADIGINVEDALLSRGAVLRATILKAPFPGLGTAQGDAFLHAVSPQTIIVAPGEKGTPSVPTKAMLAHLASSTHAAIVEPKIGSFLLYNK